MAVLAQLANGVVTHQFEVKSGKLSIGRTPNNDVAIDDTSVSSNHAVIERVPNPDSPKIVDYYIHDLNSTNGTKVNGIKISKAQKLHHNDAVQIAWSAFKFLDGEATDLAKTAHAVK